MLFQPVEGAGPLHAELPGRPRAGGDHQQGTGVQPPGGEEAQLLQHQDRGTEVRTRPTQQREERGELNI